jgi:hypothetical protein
VVLNQTMYEGAKPPLPAPVQLQAVGKDTSFDACFGRLLPVEARPLFEPMKMEGRKTASTVAAVPAWLVTLKDVPLTVTVCVAGATTSLTTT